MLQDVTAGVLSCDMLLLVSLIISLVSSVFCGCVVILETEVLIIIPFSRSRVVGINIRMIVKSRY